MKKSSNKDRISNLPDDVLCQILSFLPTIDSIGTSILSSRWKDLWKHVTKLHFDDTLPPFNCPHVFPFIDPTSYTAKFAKLVNRVLLLNDTDCLDTFSLRCSKGSMSYDVGSWIRYVISKGIKTVDVLATKPLFEDPDRKCKQILPSSLFTCKTLEVLRLNCAILIGPATKICLPKLRVLKLVGLDFEDVKIVSEIISSSTSLESLDVESFEIVDFVISSCTLRDLQVRLLSDDWETHHKVVINASALQRIRLSSEIWVDYQIGNLPLLEEAEIQIQQSLHISFDRFLGVLGNIFRAFQNVKILTIDTRTFKVIVPEDVFPMFHRLIVLKMKYACCGWRMMQAFIKKSTNLKELTITVDFSDCDDHEICWTNSLSVCSLTCLRAITIHGFKGLEHEMAMVRYIHENARILEKLKMLLSCSLDNKTKWKLHKKVSKIFGGLENFELSIY